MPQDARVLIVDDSSIVRQVLSRELSQQHGITVVGTAPNPHLARDMILELEPNVLTLDIEMPRMDGLSFLKRIMAYHPMPVIIVSSLTDHGKNTTLACLAAGAIDVVRKPDASYSIGDLGGRLGDLIREARHIRVAKRTMTGPTVTNTTPRDFTSPPTAMIETTNKVVAIGASTGGTEALRTILQAMPRMCPGIVMTQHMPEGFTASFAERLNTLCEIEVREASDGDWVVPGQALLAPGNRHMKLARDGARYTVHITDGPPICRHRPSVEVLFESTARVAGTNAMGVILTGMGSDGAQGLLTMRRSGAVTVAQDESSCIVFGMPREAIKCGGASIVAPLDRIPEYISRFAAGCLESTEPRQVG